MGGAEGLQAMQLLLKEYPQAVQEKTLDGWLPLHRVARHMGGAEGLEAMQLLLKEYPQAVQEKTLNGWLPLHFVARHMGGAEGLEAMQLLLTEYPKAAEEKESNGNLAIHHICWNESENGATLEMVRELLSAYPQGIKEKGETNYAPYADAVRFKKLPTDAIDFLRRAEQGASTHSRTHTPSSLIPFSYCVLSAICAACCAMRGVSGDVFSTLAHLCTSSIASGLCITQRKERAKRDMRARIHTLSHCHTHFHTFTHTHTLHTALSYTQSQPQEDVSIQARDIIVNPFALACA
jgi:ankyrin repeat protein